VRRGPLACTARASTSLPTPDSPSSSSAMGLSSTRRARSSSAAWRRRRCPARPARRPAARPARHARRGPGCAAEVQTQPQRRRPSRAAGSCGTPARSGASPGPAGHARARAPMSCGRSPAGRARRALAPISQPSSESATRPSVTLPSPSVCGCRRSCRPLPCRCLEQLVLDDARARAHQAQRVAVVAAPVARDVEHAQQPARGSRWARRRRSGSRCAPGSARRRAPPPPRRRPARCRWHWCRATARSRWRRGAAPRAPRGRQSARRPARAAACPAGRRASPGCRCRHLLVQEGHHRLRLRQQRAAVLKRRASCAPDACGAPGGGRAAPAHGPGCAAQLPPARAPAGRRPPHPARATGARGAVARRAGGAAVAGAGAVMAQA
jgi:hypothetical protein